MARRFHPAVFVPVLAAVAAAVAALWPRHDESVGPGAALAAPTVSLPSQSTVPDRPPLQPDTRPAPAVSWDAQSRASDDYFAFARAAGVAAKAGDGRAQYRLYEALLECELLKRTLGSSSAGLESAIAAHFARLPGMSEGLRAHFRARVERCRGFLDGASPFAGLALPAAAASYTYWREQAEASGDPLAVMGRASRLSGSDDWQGESGDRRRAAILADVRVAVESREPEALLRVGGIYMSIGRERAVRPLAWILAACEAGFDCSNANLYANTGCVRAGLCDPGMTIADNLQRDLGPTVYAQIYALSQEILDKVNRGDWDGLQPHLEIRQY